MLYSLD